MNFEDEKIGEQAKKENEIFDSLIEEHKSDFDIISGAQEESSLIEEVLENPETKKKLEFFPGVKGRLRKALHVFFLSSLLVTGLSSIAKAAESSSGNIGDKGSISVLFEGGDDPNNGNDKLEKIIGNSVYQMNLDANLDNSSFSESGELGEEGGNLIVSEVVSSSEQTNEESSLNNDFHKILNVEKLGVSTEAVGEPMEFESSGKTLNSAVANALGDAASFLEIELSAHEKSIDIDRGDNHESSHAKDIKKASTGVIHSYKVVSHESDGHGYSAKVIVSFGRMAN